MVVLPLGVSMTTLRSGSWVTPLDCSTCGLLGVACGGPCVEAGAGVWVSAGAAVWVRIAATVCWAARDGLEVAVGLDPPQPARLIKTKRNRNPPKMMLDFLRNLIQTPPHKIFEPDIAPARPELDLMGTGMSMRMPFAIL